MSDRFTSVPAGWKPADHLFEFALQRALAALDAQTAFDNLVRYYRLDFNYAGNSFLAIGNNDPYALTEGDLLAITLLNVEAPPVAVRRFLEPSRTRGWLHRLLSDEHLPIDADLAVADARQLEDMSAFYQAVRASLSPDHVKNPNAWVTASKLCARKRPDLFPVRDRIVCRYLGLPANYQIDWQVFRHLIQNSEVRRLLDSLVDSASREAGVDVGHPNRRLRHLDVALWMHASGRGLRGDPGDGQMAVAESGDL